MTRAQAMAKLRAHEAELRAMGIAHLALFGSTARNEAGEKSDLDLAIRLHPDVRLGWAFATLDQRISALIGVRVDVVTEPSHRARLQAEINRDRANVF